jgi:hypothetical protein
VNACRLLSTSQQRSFLFQTKNRAKEREREREREREMRERRGERERGEGERERATNLLIHNNTKIEIYFRDASFVFFFCVKMQNVVVVVDVDDVVDRGDSPIPLFEFI